MIGDSLEGCNLILPGNDIDAAEFVNHFVKSSPPGFDIYLDRKDQIILLRQGFRRI